MSNHAAWHHALQTYFSVALFTLALIVFFLEWVIQRHRQRTNIYEILYHWTALFPLGVYALYLFITNAIFSNIIQMESLQKTTTVYNVGLANAVIATLAISSFTESYGFRLAAVIASSIWLWGTAVGVIYQMIAQRNIIWGNLDAWFWISVIIPFILIYCIIKLKPANRPVSYNPL